MQPLHVNKHWYTLHPDDTTHYFGEKNKTIEGKQYRLWDPSKSKLAAALRNGLKTLPIKEDTRILYLGAAAGTTISHLSDIADQGAIYGVELSREMLVRFLHLATNRENVIPIFANALHPETYEGHLTKPCGLLVQDIPSRDQLRILSKNTHYLKPGGEILLSLKTRSIDSSKKPSQVMEEQKALLRKQFSILQTVNLAPYHKDHWMLHLRV